LVRPPEKSQKNNGEEIPKKLVEDICGKIGIEFLPRKIHHPTPLVHPFSEKQKPNKINRY
jgi:hypothetical protein